MNALQEPEVMTSKETAPLIIERVMDAHTVTEANKDMNGTVIEIDSDATEYKPQL